MEEEKEVEVVVWLNRPFLRSSPSSDVLGFHPEFSALRKEARRSRKKKEDLWLPRISTRNFREATW